MAAKNIDGIAQNLVGIKDDTLDWLKPRPKIKNLPNRKRYENFDPYPNSTPINPQNPGGSPDVVGADRIYALFQHAIDNNLDFAKVLANDRERFPDRTPNVLEFENDRFDLFNGSSGGDHWKRATPKDIEDYQKNGDRFGEIKDGWRHISRGTRYGDDIFNLLLKGDFK